MYDNGVTYLYIQHTNVYLMTASRQNCNAASLLTFLHRVVDVSVDVVIVFVPFMVVVLEKWLINTDKMHHYLIASIFVELEIRGYDSFLVFRCSNIILKSWKRNHLEITLWLWYVNIYFLFLHDIYHNLFPEAIQRIISFFPCSYGSMNYLMK